MAPKREPQEERDVGTEFQFFSPEDARGRPRPYCHDCRCQPCMCSAVADGFVSRYAWRRAVTGRGL